MTFTIEPMLNLGTHEWEMWDDDWTVVTRDRRRSAQFEHTLLVTPTGAEVLTQPRAHPDAGRSPVSSGQGVTASSASTIPSPA